MNDGFVEQYVRLVADEFGRRRDPGHGTVVEVVPVAGDRVPAERRVVSGYGRTRVVGHRVQVVLVAVRRLYAAGRPGHVRAHVQRRQREHDQRRDLLVRVRALETFQVQHQVPGQLLETVRLVHLPVRLAHAAPGPFAVVQHLFLREVVQQVGERHLVGRTAARRQRQRQVPKHLRGPKGRPMHYYCYYTSSGLFTGGIFFGTPPLFFPEDNENINRRPPWGQIRFNRFQFRRKNATASSK